MRKTGLLFDWEKGSLNTSAIEVFKKNKIPYEYNKYGVLTADFYGIGIFEKIDFENIKNDTFEIVF